MPGEPTVARQDLVAKNGRPVRYTNYAVDLGTRAYTVSYSDYDRETGIDLDSAVAGILGDPRQVRNLDRRTITLFERPGRVVDFVKEGYRWRVRLFAVGHRLYQIGVIAVPDRFEDTAPDFYMNSFWLNP